MKIASHAWLEIAPWKMSLSFKKMKNIKIVHQVFTINNFTTKMIFYKKKNNLWCHSEGKIWRHFSPATMDGFPILNGFFCACRYFCIKYCSAKCRTTTDFNRLLYLMCFFIFFALIKVFCIHDNIYSTALIYITCIRTSKKSWLLF